jgi:hypothetical protein
MSSHLELFKEFIFDKIMVELKKEKDSSDILFYREFNKYNMLKAHNHNHTHTNKKYVLVKKNQPTFIAAVSNVSTVATVESLINLN